MDHDADLDSLLTLYAQFCADADVEPLPDDEMREQATAMLKLLGPAFEVSFRRH